MPSCAVEKQNGTQAPLGSGSVTHVLTEQSGPAVITLITPLLGAVNALYVWKLKHT